MTWKASRITAWLYPSLLFLSILGNLWLGGMVLGKNPKSRDLGRVVSMRQLAERAQTLSEPDKTRIETLLKQHRAEAMPQIKELHAQRDRLRDIGRTGPLDEAALKQALGDYYGKLSLLQQKHQETVLQALPAFSATDREDFLQKR